jgi:hypothetical protein
MKRIGILLAALFVGIVWSARGDESPQMQLDFVRKLRDKGYVDLALEYLEAWQKKAPPEMKILLPMEMARTRIALAREKPPEQRIALIKAARTELETFVKAFGNNPEGVQARLELARLDTQEGKAVLSKALREEDTKAQQTEARAAENLFIRAGQELDAAAKLMAALATNYKNPDPKQEQLVKEQLAHDLLQARLDRGINLMEQTRTYIDLGQEAINRARAEVNEKAKKIFEGVAQEDAKNPICVMAAAWLVYCNQEAQAPKEAGDYFKLVMTQKGKAADSAKRWARFFHMQRIMKDIKGKLAEPTLAKLTEQKKLKILEDEALKWLAVYPSHAKAPEGQGVRWELANCYIKEALLAGKNDLNSPKAAAMVAKAQKVLAALAEGDSDYAEQASTLNLTLNVSRIAAVPISKLKTFDDIYLKGHYEWNQVKKVVGKLAAPDLKGEEKKKLVKERHDRLEEVIKAFTLALRKADAKTPVSKKDDARFFRVMAYLELGDLHRAAVAGEALARQQPPRKRAAAAAGYALEAYASILARDSNDDNRERLLHLANFILKDQGKIWAHEPVVPAAHYKLAMTYKGDGNFKEAVAQLEQLDDSYPGFTYAQGQLVFIALEARNKSKDEKEKNFFQDKALAALKRIPKLPAAADPSTATMFFFAQMEYPKWLFGEAAADLAKNDLVKASAKYKEMAAFNQQLQAQLAKSPVKISAENKDKLTFTLGVLEKYGRLGLAEIEYRKGNYDLVLSPPLTGAVVVEVQKLGAKAGPIPMREYQVVGDILGLALRASVQKGKIAEAKNVLALIQRLTSDGGEFADRTGVLRTLVQDLEVQVRALKKANDAAKLKTFVGNFTGLVDEMAKGTKGVDPTTFFFLARLYDSLDQHQKAADMYGKIPPPKALAKPKGEKFTDDEEKEIQSYWYSQVQCARQLRQIEGDKKKENLEKANKMINDLLRHVHARGQQLAEKEKIFILQEKGAYGPAATQWEVVMKNPVLQKQMADGDQNAKESYFDAYYQKTYCIYKYSRTDGAKSKKLDKAYLRRAADYIFKLEIAQNQEGWELLRPRFQELMESELPLRDMVEQLKKNQKKKTAK